ncbi:ThuA domain-containing protein [Kitasatospora sp. NPDC088346]|uniref:ThuA domain-containing protein n=1 Tax=Kitasatospora sp. NPDC088346 TaxID=3364073 RepID=UPI00380AC4A0
MAGTARRAVVVRGGWDGHAPTEATERFIPFLREQGFEVVVSESLDAYTDTALMARTDLVLQCWTMGSPDEGQVDGLRTAVEAGTGFAGWHGGIVDSFRSSPAYLQLVGAQFAAHPGGVHEHTVEVVPARADHEIVRGLPPAFTVEDEQYWVATDPRIEVLATTTVPSRDGDPWHTPVTFPAVWTRRWGAGRIFVCTPGHRLPTLDVPQIRTVIERGLLWASR